ncbi:hypothetical protein LTR10_020267 [Elasticomyces elasticus]|uniref:BTB domain-containing protein n=1 Tax=Exophiala sideris TaxID=1016849 RepID=A0ABR0IVQ5_9EURO|nr:hypothetical protein LTR10_020267 [Elasticomyces elasticus]KAK5021287.1 hypothetical protein LTS07_011126 [Exophiala sideris]KAK5024242.1 hypothetical protein LTR13_010951 [Exophiala sideris]KAK5049184.1 hypothetical protein LTR69_011148 [Exophiala sideris]KAK5176495.1 hypothetical protein LTR44_010973 [Eurotiomycetes sp. CCFEE 6388]
MTETKVVKAGMTTSHARSRTVKVFIRQVHVDDDGRWPAQSIYEPDPDDIRMTVFNVHTSFLGEHAQYFAGMPDCDNALVPVSEPTRISDNIKAYHVFEDWLDAMYQGKIERINSIPLKDFELQPHFDLADFLVSTFFKNVIMDTIQQRGIDTWTVDQVKGLHMMRKSAFMYVDYAIECMAYRIVTRGWTGVMDADLGVCVTKWKEFMREGRNIDTFNELLARVDILHKAKDTNNLICPTDLKDCKWHEHTDDDRKECPRYRPEN